MSDTETINGQPPFSSLTIFQAAHENLLQRRREQGDAQEFLRALDEFIQRGRATGMLLEALNDRRVAQGMLNFWANTLYRAGFEPPDAALADFDSSLAPELEAALCPYLGLDAFDENHHNVFFGRQHLVEQLVGRLRDNRLLAVVGPSGSGKSSVVRAGIIPTLREGALPGSQGWRYLPPMVPGSEPLVALAQLAEAAGISLGVSLQEQVVQLRQNSRRLVELADQTGASPLVLVVDQFEEVFRLCDDEGARAAFISNVLNCIQDSASRHTIILTMRSDFETYVARVESLQPLFEQARVQLTPLSAAELREAIEKPAERVGLKFEHGVVEALVQDILGEPAGLPLLQFTLLKLWGLRERNRVSWSAYEHVGGGRRALARSADELYEGLIYEEQITLRRILLRIVRPGEGLEVTSHRVRRDLLYQGGEARDRVDHVLEKLLQTRLLRQTVGVTPADTQVEVAHEALIRNWPRLVEWLDEERAAILTRRRIETMAAEWVRLGQGRGGLLDTEQLHEAEKWLASPQAAYLGYDPSVDALVLASHQAIQRAARARFVLLFGLYMAMAVALVFAIVAYIQAQQLAASELSRRQQAEQQARDAHLNQLAAQSQSSLGQSPQRSLLLAVEALSTTTSLITPTISGDSVATLNAQSLLTRESNSGSAVAEESLWRALGYIGGRSLAGHTDRLTALAVSASSHWLATGSADRTVRLWNLTAENPADTSTVLSGHIAPITAIAFSPDDHWLATTAGTDPDTNAPDTMIRLWDLTASKPTALVLHDHTAPVTAVVFSSDGRWLISGGDLNILTGQIDAIVRVWDLANLHAPPRRLVGHQEGITAIVISPDSRRFVTTSKDNTAIVWSLTDTKTSPVVLRGHRGIVTAAAISSDGRWLVTGGTDGTARRWNLSAPDPAANPTVLRGHTASINALAMSADGHWLVTGSADSTARRWDLTTPDPTMNSSVLRGHTASINAVTLSADGQWLVTGSADRTVRRWNLSDKDDPEAAPTVLHGHDGEIVAVALTQDERWLASASADGTGRLWDLTVAEQLNTPIILSGGIGPLTSVAISPSNRWLAAGSDNGTILLWDAREPNAHTSPLLLREHSAAIDAIAISPDERWLVTGSQDRTVRLWSLMGDSPGSRVVILQKYDALITVLTISPDSRWLVTASDNPGRAQLWNLSAADPATSPIELHGYTGAIRAVAISADSHWLVAGGDDQIARIWNLANPSAVPIVLNGHQGSITSIAISTDSRYVVTGSQDATARLWNLTVSNPVSRAIVLRGHIKPISVVAFSSDKRWLATGSDDGTTRLWKLDLLDPSTAPIVLGGHSDSITAVAFWDDSHWLATASTDATARLWNLDAPDPSVVSVGLYGHRGGIASAMISADGHWLVTAGDDGTVRLWTLRLAELLGQACHVVGRNLSAVEWRQSYPDQPYRKTCTNLPIHRSVIQEMLFQADSAALAGDPSTAARAYQKAVESVVASDDVALNNSICWLGSIDGFASVVLPACDHAVALSPDTGLIRDSRGLARALLGKYLDASEDFQSAVDWAAYDAGFDHFRAKREDWIRQLRSGHNPFDGTTLHSLRGESL